MGLAQKIQYYIRPEDYLLLEEKATTKHEYLDGVIYEWQGGGPHNMAGGSIPHSRAIYKVGRSLDDQLRGQPCLMLLSEVRLHTADKSAYFYPDVVVTCSAADRARSDGISEPTVVVEVLSPSTELFDRGDKFKIYRSFETLQSYVLVSPERRTIEVFTRANQWEAIAGQDYQRLAGPEVISVGALGLQLLASDVFDDI